MQRKKVLIIDDDARNIIALGAVLRAHHYNCVTATGAQQGIDMLGSDEDVGIVLLDMMMPEMDGYEALPLLRGKRLVPVVAVTAQAMVGDREKCMQAGASGYISKPVDVDKLLMILKTHLK